ncbi:hypothetical protein [Mariniflexile sp.]|uniref:hypothetical protein n=1 Tax=Mariniflexile sp. TaxID=1979402 RepID=UPI004048C14A
MNKIINIYIQEPFKILCFFENGEQKILDLQQVLNPEQKYMKSILNKKVFNQAKIGSFGEIYWEGVAQMKDLNGITIPCNYDISPDFAYLKSISSKVNAQFD